MAVTFRRRDSGSGPGPVSSDLLANCDAADEVGDAVYINADKIGDRYQVHRVDVDDVVEPYKAIGMGIIREKTTDTECSVRISGVLEGVYTGLTPGKRLFVGINSRPNHTPPTRPTSGKRILQKVGYAIASDTILVVPEEPTRIIPL